MAGGRDGEELRRALDQPEDDRGDDGWHGFKLHRLAVLDHASPHASDSSRVSIASRCGIASAGLAESDNVHPPAGASRSSAWSIAPPSRTPGRPTPFFRNARTS